MNTVTEASHGNPLLGLKLSEGLARCNRSERMAELAPHHARDVARTAMGYSQAFDGRNIDWHSDEPWPHRIELAQALDWITELGAMVLNLADRVEKAEGPNVI